VRHAFKMVSPGTGWAGGSRSLCIPSTRAATDVVLTARHASQGNRSIVPEPAGGLKTGLAYSM
jgi:hypothetical protein